MALQFYIVDVFAKESYAGNPLAVVIDEYTLSKEVMQKIAAEMNFSETTFINPVPESDNGYRVRIFTPTKEIVFAGHPVLGAAKIVRDHIIAKSDSQVTLNLTVGQIPVIFESQVKEQEVVWFRAPPMMLQNTIPHAEIAPAVGLSPEDINTTSPVQIISAQTAAIIIPLNSLEALQRCHLDLNTFAPFKEQGFPPLVYLFCDQTKFESNDLSVRFFFEANGVREDPATGNGAAFLGAYLLEHKIYANSNISLRIEQGHGLGRPSLIMLRAQIKNDIPEVYVGGSVIPVVQGNLL